MSNVHYASLAESEGERDRMLALMAAIDTRDTTVRRDECSCWRLSGAKGHAYVSGTGFLVYVGGSTGHHWLEARRRFRGYGTITQDGDIDGVIRIEGLPDADQAKLLRWAMGLPLRRHLSDEQRERLSVNWFSSRSQKPANE